MDAPARGYLTRRGVFSWNGAGGNTFLVDPASGLSAVLMIQVRHATNPFWEGLLHRMVFAALT